MNKGAELMLRAILERVRPEFPGASLTMAPVFAHQPQPFMKMVDTGMFPKAWLYRYGMHLSDIAKVIPKRYRDLYGVVLDHEVDVVLDAAGFCYSDQWGLRHSKELARSAKRWYRRGTKVILLPQAFGPFRGRRMRQYITSVADHCDLICVRDAVSFNYLTEVAGPRRNICEYPDFTNLLNGVVPDMFDKAKHGVAIVPNYRMIDKTTNETSSEYVRFMKICARRLYEWGMRPYVLIHEGAKDEWLATQIVQDIGDIPTVKLVDPVEIKGILGASYAVIGSRFHALVSALSQGVPCLATGWSHKYQQLFKDYKYEDGLISVHLNEAEIADRLAELTTTNSNEQCRKRLLAEAEVQKRRSEAMWKKVFQVLGR